MQHYMVRFEFSPADVAGDFGVDLKDVQRLFDEHGDMIRYDFEEEVWNAGPKVFRKIFLRYYVEEAIKQATERGAK